MAMREKVNILMVDDQPAKLLSYEVILNELGENLIKANSGREALEHLLKEDVAVVLMDVSMPELDGFELADMIRQHPRFQKTAIIFISGVHLTDLDRLKGYQRGAVDYLSVPVNPELLRAKVSVFADLHRKTHQLEVLNRELRTLSSSLIATQDDERRRIARELHDSLGQELSAAKMMTDKIVMLNRSPESTKEATEISNLIDHSIQQVRSISYLLHPPLLDEIGLQSALQFYLEGFTKRSGIEISLDMQPSNFPRLAPEMETAIFRIVQEAVTNVFRHSGAREAWVTLVKDDIHIVGTVRDNGKGITEGVMDGRPDRVGVGIGGMRQRVKEFGGELRIGSANPGTFVEVIVPIEPAAPDSQTGIVSLSRAAQREVAL
ncbi:MAG TPA: response regulator [Candidatus Acidoferrales bacterium]|jgi:signal transduction histidine kinase|nr:response regulator [Candidatus Acidoferrales bacterium]